MKDKLLVKALGRCNAHRPPVWLMRQAGRYHRHYQILKKQHSFMELCKRPELSCEVTMGPIEDFDFDAAILFSDLLFPLEAMGMGLKWRNVSKGEKPKASRKTGSILSNESGGTSSCSLASSST